VFTYPGAPNPLLLLLFDPSVLLPKSSLNMSSPDFYYDYDLCYTLV